MSKFKLNFGDIELKIPNIFFSYKYGNGTKLLCEELPKMNGYAKFFDETKN